MAGKRLIDPAALLVRRRNYVRHFEDVSEARVFLQKMVSNQTFMDPPDAGHARDLRIANQRCSEDCAGNDRIKTARKLDEALVAPHREATTEFGEHLVSSGQQWVHNERNIGIEKSFSQWSIHRRHHYDKNSVRPAPLRQMRKNDGRATQAQLVRD